MKIWKVLTSLVLCAVLLTSAVIPAAAAEETELDTLISETAAALAAMGGHKGDLLADADYVNPGSSLSDWIALTLARCDVPESYSQYLDALKIYVEKCYAEDGGLHDVKATEYHRISLTVLSLGGDPTNFGTKPDGTPIDLIADGTYNFGEKELGLQGLNGWIWALIALDASGVEVPEDARYSRQDMIEAILSAQNDDGSFALDTGSGDVDITAMAVQALSPYYGEYRTQVDLALTWLSYVMNADGTYTYGTAVSSESLSQVILALSALNYGVGDFVGFVRDGQTMYQTIKRFRCADGMFCHELGSEQSDGLATVQALQALISIRNHEKGWPYIFGLSGPYFPTQSDAAGTAVTPAAKTNAPAEAKQSSSMRILWIGLAAEVVIIGAIIAIVVIKRRKKHG